MPGESSEITDVQMRKMVCRRHLIFGWGMLFCFVVLGVILEALHGFKVGWYLDVGNEIRRLMLRLSHAHGTLMAVLNIAFALSLGHFEKWTMPRIERASIALRIASVLLPGGFFAGGLFSYDGDPGLGIILAPFGALAMVLSTYLIFRGSLSNPKK